jgi:sugar phosphate isomerase/epimerase
MSRFILSAFADEIASDLKIQMEVLKKYGISYIEMRGVNGKNIVEHTLTEAKEIKKQLEAQGFRLSSIGSPIGKISIRDNFQPHLDLFKHTLELTELLECKFIRMFSFYIPKGEDPELYRSEVLYRWFEFAAFAKGTGITLLHENEKDIFGDTALRCLNLMQAINSEQVRAVFDPANFVQCDVKTYPDAYQLLEKYIAYVHIKDALSSDHSVVPAGQGDGKIKDILQALSQNGYEGFLSLESHLGQFPGFAELEQSAVIKSIPDNASSYNGPELFAIVEGALRKILDEI